MKQMPFRTMGRAMALGLCLFACASCGTAVRQGRGSSYLVIDALLAASGAEPDKLSNSLSSDVQTIVKVDDVPTPVIYEDRAQAVVRVSMKDPTSTTQPSTTNEITLTGYHVTFKRADGRNAPGVDVPYAFDGAVTATAKVGSTVTVQFVLVRVQAKIEPPLVAMINGGGAIFISTIAEVTLYGHDQAGNQVNVTGAINVNFGNWADPQ